MCCVCRTLFLNEPDIVSAVFRKELVDPVLKRNIICAVVGVQDCKDNSLELPFKLGRVKSLQELLRN